MSGASLCFQNWVRGRGMVDLGFVGNRYTWCHGSNMETRRTVRLDWALNCYGWRRLFAKATVRHLCHVHSDHCLILLELGGVRKKRLEDRPFHFQAAWLLHPGFYSWMEKEWIRGGNLMQSLTRFSEKLNAWNKDTFGCIFERKKRTRRRLEGAVRALDQRPSLGLLKLEKKLKKEWVEALMQEEMLRMQKLHVDWLRHGDRNTEFFHISTVERRKRSGMAMLQDENGTWVEEDELLKNMAIRYFSELFTADTEIGGSLINSAFLLLEEGVKEEMCRELTIEETKRAL